MSLMIGATTIGILSHGPMRCKVAVLGQTVVQTVQRDGREWEVTYSAKAGAELADMLMEAAKLAKALSGARQ